MDRIKVAKEILLLARSLVAATVPVNKDGEEFTRSELAYIKKVAAVMGRPWQAIASRTNYTDIIMEGFERDSSPEEVANAIKKYNHSRTGASIPSGSYEVVWVDRHYRTNKKVFKNKSEGAAGNAEKAARQFAEKLEKDDDKSEYGNIRGRVTVRAISASRMSSDSIFADDDADASARSLLQEMENVVPFARVVVSRLGGPSRYSLMAVFSLDPKSEWQNGIIENSRMGRISVSQDGEIELFQRSPGVGKFRRTRVNSLDLAAKKISQYLKGAGE